MEKVVFVRGSDPYENTRRILERLKGDILSTLRSPVLIKPNLVNDKLRLVTTKVEVVEAVVDFLNDNAKCKIVIGEGSTGKTNKAFKNFGYNKLAKRIIKFVDFNKDKWKELEIIGPTTGKPRKVKIAKTATDANFIISTALLKTHDYGIATFSLKNMIGALVGKDKKKVHGKPLTELEGKELRNTIRNFHQNVYRIAKRVTPHLAILDGTSGIQGNVPSGGEEVKMNLGLGSMDPVACDACASYLIGFDPMEIGYIYYAEKEKLGCADLAKIKVVGDVDWEHARKNFKPHPNYSHMLFVP